MKQLDTTFTQDNQVLTQIKRSDKAALYKRETLEGQPVSYEVFAIKTKNDAEIYPAKHAFGGPLGWAWCPIQLEKAETYFGRLNNSEIALADVDPETGVMNQAADNRSLDELPDVNVDVNAVTAPADPTAPTVQPPADVPAPVVQPTPDGGATVTVATVSAPKAVVVFNYPVGDFTQAQFAQANSMPERGSVWGVLDKLVKSGKLTKVLKQLGKGRLSQVFTVKS